MKSPSAHSTMDTAEIVAIRSMMGTEVTFGALITDVMLEDPSGMLVAGN